MQPQEIIESTEAFVKESLQSAEAGHDWHHINRVRNMALYLCEKEGANAFHLELAALLHDISDAKFNGGDEKLGAVKSREFLASLNLSPTDIARVTYLVENCSFKGGHGLKADDLDLQILQDADRLDAIGAIGIARTFNYGGFKGAPMHLPDQAARSQFSLKEYREDKGTTINHFYEKLLKLKDGMYTATARNIAEKRHAFMLSFLEQFYEEWDGPKG